LTKNDESTKIPGVFLVSPTVSHGTLSFCFVYKFRQRFTVVANSICGGLGIDTRAVVAECRKANMYLDEFSCCSDTCGDVC
jgi:putative flavoprotein involved in K+ transport